MFLVPVSWGLRPVQRAWLCKRACCEESMLLNHLSLVFLGGRALPALARITAQLAFNQHLSPESGAKDLESKKEPGA